MKKKSILRGIMLVGGLIAVCAILLSPAFSQVKFKEQVKKEQSSEKETQIIPAPTEAIPGSAVKIDEPAAPLLTQIEETSKKEFLTIVPTREATKYFRVLLRTLIAPNAP